MKNVLLQVQGLKTIFETEEGIIEAIDDISFEIKQGETVGLVGESGCGKSVTSLSIMKLLPYNGKIANGKIIFDGNDLLKKSDSEMRKIRGKSISMIFQEPMTSLNPVFTVGNQISEVFRLHQGLNKKKALEKSIEALKMVEIPLPEKRIKEYPHQLSGGMRQRVMIAMALACNPKLLIADEPTTALDVTIQAQILELMKDLKQNFNTAIMLITHDLGVVAEMTERVIVMYAGKIVETSPVNLLFKNPLHPYTEGLMKSIPRLDDEKDDEQLHVIKGMVPHPLKRPKGCRFAPRCTHADTVCFDKEPPPVKIDMERIVSCWMYTKDREGEKIG